jgi:hypothetical protein
MRAGAGEGAGGGGCVTRWVGRGVVAACASVADRGVAGVAALSSARAQEMLSSPARPPLPAGMPAIPASGPLTVTGGGAPCPRHAPRRSPLLESAAAAWRGGLQAYPRLRSWCRMLRRQAACSYPRRTVRVTNGRRGQRHQSPSPRRNAAGAAVTPHNIGEGHTATPAAEAGHMFDSELAASRAAIVPGRPPTDCQGQRVRCPAAGPGY